MPTPGGVVNQEPTLGSGIKRNRKPNSPFGTNTRAAIQNRGKGLATYPQSFGCVAQVLVGVPIASALPHFLAIELPGISARHSPPGHLEPARGALLQFRRELQQIPGFGLAGLDPLAILDMTSERGMHCRL